MNSYTFMLKTNDNNNNNKINIEFGIELKFHQKSDTNSYEEINARLNYTNKSYTTDNFLI